MSETWLKEKNFTVEGAERKKREHRAKRVFTSA
jgi:hypothetical protein